MTISEDTSFSEGICQREAGTIVQEDKEPAHSHHVHQRIYDANSVMRLLWCGNSPGLNTIEPAWPYLRGNLRRRGPLGPVRKLFALGRQLGTSFCKRRSKLG